ncbi:MAG TPA: iron ABC transporter permease [Fibrobacteraceae bacterium]|nr:iron ABC transporter permease [Fibrobacteraceae bacterium]
MTWIRNNGIYAFFSRAALPSLALLLLFSLVASFSLGRYGLPVSSLGRALWEGVTGATSGDSIAQTVLFEIRLPRILAAVLTGGSMALAGASYQGMFKNPMVSPDILGASAGAGFGAALAILLSRTAAEIQIYAFLCGLGAVVLTMTIARSISRSESMTLVLVLTGMVVSTLFSSLISITKFVADPDNKLPAITFWLMGGLASVGKHDALLLLALSAAASLPLFLIRWKLNVLAFGDEEARALGIDVPHLRLLVILASTLLTAASVSLCGMVGWIGLVIPHMARLLVGPNFKTLLPASALLGATFLLWVDNAARCVFPVEIPLGILTSLVGAPFFLYLLMKGKKGWT